MGSTTDDAVSLLSVDVAAITANVAKEALAAEKEYVEALPDDKLFAEAAHVEAELAKALAALEKKKGGAAKVAAPCTDGCKGPIAFFEGTPIDCGSVADAAITAHLDSMSDGELQALIATTEAEIGKAKAVLESKRANPAAPASPARVTTPSAAGAASSESPLKRMGESAKQLIETTYEKSKPLLDATSEKSKQLLETTRESSKQVLETASEKTGVPPTTLAATIAAGAAVAMAGLVSVFRRK